MSSDYCATDVPRPTHRLYVDEYGHDGMTTFTEDNDRYLSVVSSNRLNNPKMVV